MDEELKSFVSDHKLNLYITMNMEIFLYLIEKIREAKPVDYEYEGYYLDGSSRVRHDVKNGEPFCGRRKRWIRIARSFVRLIRLFILHVNNRKWYLKDIKEREMNVIP